MAGVVTAVKGKLPGIGSADHMWSAGETMHGAIMRAGPEVG
jgi:hypothetical protein